MFWATLPVSLSKKNKNFKIDWHLKIFLNTSVLYAQSNYVGSSAEVSDLYLKIVPQIKMDFLEKQICVLKE